MISYDDFKKLDIRVGTIVKVENVEGADKLYRLTVDIGVEKRTIASGIKEHYKPDELMNKQIIVLTNLEPKVIRGVESNGMLLAAWDEKKNKLVFLTPKKKMANGTKVY